MFLWVFVSALFFNLFHSLPHGHLPEHPSLEERLLAMPWLLLLFLGASVFASYWIRKDVEEEDYQNKHQDYRALAEALRIQFFWHVAGVPAKVVDHYLRKQRGALEWIRNALRAWDAEALPYRITRGAAAPVTEVRARLRRAALGQRAAELLCLEGATRAGDARGGRAQDRVARPQSASSWRCCWRSCSPCRCSCRSTNSRRSSTWSRTRGFTAS